MANNPPEQPLPSVDWVQRDRLAWERVTVVTVTHKSGRVIGTCLQNLSHALRVVVVDNASDDDTREIVRQTAPQADLVLNPVGLGYGNGANLGLERVGTEFALMVNPDSIIPEGAVAKLVDAADQFPEAAMLAGALINDDGSVELSHDVGLFDRRNYGKRGNEPDPCGPLCAEFLSGAVVLLRMAHLRKTGFFDPHFFLYYEDDDMCLRLRRAGYSLILVPDARIRHVGGGSVRPSAHYYWEKFWHFAWSRLYLEEKYHGFVAMLKVALPNLVKLFFKALGYGLTLQRPKARRDAAKFLGTFGYLLGQRASHTVPPGRPQFDPDIRVVLRLGPPTT